MLTLHLADPEATDRLGEDLARALKQGDVLALSGDLGAGKSSLARAFIRAMAHDASLDVPSPTFTLVQTYAARIPVSHFDLYRLDSPLEFEELGFDEAASAGICLIEWPERAGSLLPQTVIRLHLTDAGEGRQAQIDGPQSAIERISRTLAIRAFLAANNLETARRSWFQGDASTRTFERVGAPDGRSAILMDHPEKPDLSPVVNGRSYRQTARITWTVTPFVAVARALRQHGFAAPEILAADLDQGILLMEDLGPGKIVDDAGMPIAERYCEAGKLLAKLHVAKFDRDLPLGKNSAYRLPPYDRDALMIEARLMLDWYVPFRLGRGANAQETLQFEAIWDQLITLLSQSETGLLLRDYHSPNIIWRNEKSGIARLGLVDIQDALHGPLSYDLSSLGQDARVTIPDALETEIFAAYAKGRRSFGAFDEAAFRQAYAITALQRATKILGIFVRLDRRDGKPDYLKHLPRIENYVRRTIHHPALAKLAEFYSSFGLV